MVRWGGEDRPDVDVGTQETGLGFQAAELDTSDLQAGCEIDFDWTWRDGDGGTNDRVRLTVAAKAMEANQ